MGFFPDGILLMGIFPDGLSSGLRFVYIYLKGGCLFGITVQISEAPLRFHGTLSSRILSASSSKAHSSRDLFFCLRTFINCGVV